MSSTHDSDHHLRADLQGSGILATLSLMGVMWVDHVRRKSDTVWLFRMVRREEGSYIVTK